MQIMLKNDMSNQEITGLKNKSKLKIGLTLKVTALIALLIGLVSSISIYLIFNLGYKALKEEIKDKLIIMASNAAVRLEPEKLLTIKTEEDEKSEAYLELQKKLQEIQKASRNKVRYIYTVAKEGNSYKYILDATPIGAKDHSTVGDTFPLQEFPVAAKGFTAEAVEEEPTYDEEFKIYCQSGYVPLKDKSGNVIGILGVDMDVSTLKQEEKAMMDARNWAVGFSMLLSLLFGICFSKYLTKPILILTKGTKSIAEGKLDTIVEINRNDELGQLGKSFNAMTQDLKVAHEELKMYNLQLEDIVEKRTSAIRNLLNNAGQGFMVFDSGLKIHDEYSLECKRIFENEVAQVPFQELIYPDNEDERNAVESILVEYFAGKEKIVKQSLLWLLPNEMVINGKQIELSYNPIYDPIDHSEQLMVVLTDVTEKKQLESQMEEERKVLKMVVKVVTQVSDFISVKKDFEYFYQSKINQILDKDVSLKEKVLQIFKDVHTFKGNFAIYVIHVIPKLHELESQLAKLSEQEEVMSIGEFKQFLNQYDFSTWLQEDLDVLEDVLGANFFAEHNEDAVYIDRKKVMEFEKRIAPILVRDEDQALLKELREWLSKPFNSLLKNYADYICKLAQRNEIMIHPVNIEGDNVLVNPDVYDGFVKSLIHIFRNSIVHGIETPEERVDAGKEEYGAIGCSVKLNDGQIVLTISDDGRGIDTARIRAKAVEKGLCDENAVNELTDEAVINFIFLDEFSTGDEVSELAGRGVGLAAVKQEIEKLGGIVKVKTILGQGTTFEFLIPVL